MLKIEESKSAFILGIIDVIENCGIDIMINEDEELIKQLGFYIDNRIRK